MVPIIATPWQAWLIDYAPLVLFVKTQEKHCIREKNANGVMMINPVFCFIDSIRCYGRGTPKSAKGAVIINPVIPVVAGRAGC